MEIGLLFYFTLIAIALGYFVLKVIELIQEIFNLRGKPKK